MPNYFFGNKDGNIIYLNKEETAHLKIVKKEIGDILDVITGDGYYYKAMIEKISKKESNLKIITKVKYNKKLTPNISLIIGMSKWDRMRIVIEKAVELRVQDIYIYKGDRSHQNYKSLDKFNKIIIETLKQTGYPLIPTISFIELKKIKNMDTLVLDFNKNKPFKTSIEKINKKINLVIGPDVGFSEDEKKYFQENDFDIISPGETIMRFETAAIYVLSAINILKNRLI